MSPKVRPDLVTFAILAGTIGLLCACAIIQADQIFALKAEAIQRGFAFYNATNGVWQWKDK